MNTPPKCGEFKGALSTTTEAGQGKPQIVWFFCNNQKKAGAINKTEMNT